MERLFIQSLLFVVGVRITQEFCFRRSLPAGVHQKRAGVHNDAMRVSCSRLRSQAEATRIQAGLTIPNRFNQHRKVNLMKPLNLYKIDPDGLPVMHVAARSDEQAAQMFVTWEAAHELSGRSFSVELAAIDTLDRDQQLQLHELLATSTEGIARHDEDRGWIIDSDGWASFDSDEMQSPGLMRIFQMRDLAEIEALVLASDQERAAELFAQHLLAQGGDPDAVMYREVSLDNLEEPANDAVNEALDIGWDGLVTCDAQGRWAFTTPLGSHRG
jgi:hypothetical protein